VWDLKFCYDVLAPGGEKGPVIFPAFKAETTGLRHAARRCGDLLSR